MGVSAEIFFGLDGATNHKARADEKNAPSRVGLGAFVRQG